MAENFTPGETVPLTAATTSASVSFTLAQSSAYPDCLVTNAGASTAFITFGTGASALALLPAAGVQSATPILSGESLILRKGVGKTSCAAITPSGTTSLYFTAGQGN